MHVEHANQDKSLGNKKSTCTNSKAGRNGQSLKKPTTASSKISKETNKLPQARPAPRKPLALSIPAPPSKNSRIIPAGKFTKVKVTTSRVSSKVSLASTSSETSDSCLIKSSRSSTNTSDSCSMKSGKGSKSSRETLDSCSVKSGNFARSSKIGRPGLSRVSDLATSDGSLVSTSSPSSVESLPIASGKRFRRVVPSSTSSSVSSESSRSDGLDSVKVSSKFKSDAPSSLSPSSVESLPIASGRRCRRVVQSSSSSCASSLSDMLGSAQASCESKSGTDCDGFYSVKGVRGNEENEPPNIKARGRTLKDEDIFVTPAAPKSQKPKRKPRGQFPKSPFIF